MHKDFFPWGHRRNAVPVLLLLLSMATSAAHGDNTATAYYKDADGKKGAELKTALCGIVYNRSEKSYAYLWTAFQTTDVRSDGKIWDIYSDATSYEPTSKGETYSKEGDCYNREHSFPKSWFGGEVMPMFTDLHHIYPTDGYINGRRSNYPYGTTSGETYTSAHGFSKLGPCTYPGYTGRVFEPADEYKGDLARTYFYMVTCYEEKLADWYNNFGATTEVREVLDGNTYPGLSRWQLQMLMQWAKDDPVSEKEKARNDAIYAIQSNRNPFIDYPGLEEYVWGSMTNEAFSYEDYEKPVYAIPLLTVGRVTGHSAVVAWDDCKGVTEYTLQLATDDAFTTASPGDTVLTADFSDTAGWTLAGTDTYKGAGYYGAGAPAIKFNSTGDYAVSPDFGLGAMLQFWAYGNGGSDSQFVISALVGGSWRQTETVTIAKGPATYTVGLPDGTSRLRFDFIKTVNCGLDDVVVTGPSKAGSLIATETIAGTSHEFTGLSPQTTYFVRVRGNDDWSEAIAFTTAEESQGIMEIAGSPTPDGRSPDAWYDLQGRRLPSPIISAPSPGRSKGLFIRNGRLIVR